MKSPLGRWGRQWQILMAAAAVLLVLMAMDMLTAHRVLGMYIGSTTALSPDDGGSDAGQSGSGQSDTKEAIQITVAAFSSISLLISFIMGRRAWTYRGFAKGILEYNCGFRNVLFYFLLLVVAMAEILCYKMLFGLSDRSLKILLSVHTGLSMTLLCSTICFHMFGRNLDTVILRILTKRVGDRERPSLMDGIPLKKPATGKDGDGQPDSRADAANVERRLGALDIIKTLALDTGRNYDIVNQYDKAGSRYGDVLLRAVDIVLEGCTAGDYPLKVSPYWWYVMFCQITRSLLEGIRTGPCNREEGACTELLAWFASEVAVRAAGLPGGQACDPPSEGQFRGICMLAAIHTAAVDSLSAREIAEFIRIFDGKCAGLTAEAPPLRQLVNRLYTVLYIRGYYLETNMPCEESFPRHDALNGALSAIATIPWEPDFAEDPYYLWQLWSTLDERTPSVRCAPLPSMKSLRRPIAITGPRARSYFRRQYDLGRIVAKDESP